MGLAFRGLRKKKKMKRSKVEGGRGAKRNRKTVLKSDFVDIPEDVLMEILARLPADSLMMFKCVSKLWCSLISSRYFTNIFLKKSPTSISPRRRRQFMYLLDKDGHGEYCLLSASSIVKPSPFCILCQDLSIPGMGGCFVNALRGLMCFRIGTRLRICNLTTKQHVELPPLVVRWSHDMWNHFGYDPVHDQYKVLSIVWEVSKKKERVVRSEHHVLVLGPGSSWRNTITCPPPPPPPHRPYSQGISINGVLYYGSLMDDNKCVVVSFDLSSEEFNLIEFPIEASSIVCVTNLMNYKDQIAVFDYSRLENEGSVDLWVAGKSQWSNKKTFVLPIHHIRTFIPGELMMHGTSREGEIRCFDKTYSTHMICDLDTSKIISEVVLSPFHYRPFETKSFRMNYWDECFESIMYLEA